MTEYLIKEALYHKNPALDHIDTRVLRADHDEKGPYLVLDDVLFYPQGGGQPSDWGTIKRLSDEQQIDVSVVRNVDGEIRHYFVSTLTVPDQADAVAGVELQWFEGDQVSCWVDLGRRYIHAGYHSAGHLIAHLAEQLWPGIQAITSSQHAPDAAYIRFHHAEKAHQPPEFLENLSARLKTVLRQGIEPHVHLTPNGVRTVSFGEWGSAGCGGTHITNTSDIHTISLTKLKYSKDKRVSTPDGLPMPMMSISYKVNMA